MRGLPTKARLSSRGWMGTNHCDLCNYHKEDEFHVFLGCPFPVEVWKQVNSHLDLKLDPAKIAQFLALKIKNLSLPRWWYSSMVATTL